MVKTKIGEFVPVLTPNHSPYTRLIRFLLRSLHPAGAEGGER